MDGYFEEIPIGFVMDLGSHVFTAEGMRKFSETYDPHPLQIDEAAAEAGPYKALIASGFHVGGIWMCQMVDYRKRTISEGISSGNPVGDMGPSPGFRHMKWHLPIFAGDEITYSSVVTAKKYPSKWPDWGLLIFDNIATNQRGERVFEFEGSVFIERKTPFSEA